MPGTGKSGKVKTSHSEVIKKKVYYKSLLIILIPNTIEDKRLSEHNTNESVRKSNNQRGNFLFMLFFSKSKCQHQIKEYWKALKINKGSLVYVDVDFQINLKLKQKSPFSFF